MVLKKDVKKGRFLVLLLNEERHIDDAIEVAGEQKDAKSKICYVCLSRPFKDVYGELKAKKADMERFYFIDVLTSHYEKQKPSKNCIYLDSPTNLGEIKKAILAAVKEKQCDTLIIDTISAMLIYQDPSEIVKFTHDILSEKQGKENVVYLAFKYTGLRLPENECLIKDLNMFADKMIDLSLKAKAYING